MNVFRTIGGRANASGVERIDRDGKMEVLELGEAEVTPRERMTWYGKAQLDPRGKILDKIEMFDIQEDESHGNNMRVDVETRTRLPRKHQYSTEARLNEQRGDAPKFDMSVDNRDTAVGIMKGAVIPERFKLDFSEEKKTKAISSDGKKTEASSSNSRNFKIAKAFERIASALVTDSINPSTLVVISNETGLPMEDVFILERVAQTNDELVDRYAGIRGRNPRRRRRKINRKRDLSCLDEVPGTEDAPGGILEKSSDDEEELDKNHLKETALEVGLVE